LTGEGRAAAGGFSLRRMKVRIGVALGAAGVPSEFDAAVAALEAAGVDSLWLPARGAG
jgi:hypothetical protein